MRDARVPGGPVLAALLLAALLLVACASSTPDSRPSPSATPSAPSPSRTPSPSPSPTASPSALRPAVFDEAAAMAAVEHLAGRIGPRQATGPAYRRAADWVAARFRALGYAVERDRFPVPGGVSWGVPVPAGRSTNVVATLPGTDLAEPFLVVGAHLDTVPQAPGAEDNASGVSVMLSAAAAAASASTRLPVVFVAFGAEEPRGPTDDDHHYGSRAWVGDLKPAQRRALRGMLSLDRVGVGTVVPVCSAVGGRDPARVRALAAGRRAGVPTVACVNRSSDHWSFVRAGLPGVRLGSTPYAGYHSREDVPSVVSQRQLNRTGRLLLAWLAPR